VFYHARLTHLVAEIRAGLQRPVRWICLDSAAETGDTTLEAWLADSSETPPRVAWQPDDVIAIKPTGGTTGRPKGVMTTHRSLTVSITHLMLAFAYSAGEPIVNVAAAPMTHAAGLLTLPCLARGGTVVVLPKADVSTVLETSSPHAQRRSSCLRPSSTECWRTRIWTYATCRACATCCTVLPQSP
jgi:acyl-CoA synthetase (AMP-forming)/AMP-acid ligase II